MLYIFGGLPGAGKSTLAASFARERRALYLRIDTIEQVLRDAETPLSGPQGYSVAYRALQQTIYGWVWTLSLTRSTPWVSPAMPGAK
jgi:predicted kinase